MSVATRTHRERRTLVIGLTTVTAIVGFGRGVPAWRVWSSDRIASGHETQVELSRARTDVRGAKNASDTLAARSARLDSLKSVYLEGHSATAAAAGLASAVSRIAEAAGVRVASIGTRVDSSNKTSVRATASLSAVGDVRAVTRLLTAIERGPLLLSVSSVAITQGEVAAADDRAEALRIELSIDGLVSPPRDIRK